MSWGRIWTAANDPSAFRVPIPRLLDPETGNQRVVDAIIHQDHADAMTMSCRAPLRAPSSPMMVRIPGGIREPAECARGKTWFGVGLSPVFVDFWPSLPV